MWRSVLLIACLATGPVVAQEDDRDYLTAFLEDTLSDAGRQVMVTGFTGALSSRATIERLTIADDTGVWITLNDVVLDWSRSSLLSGALEVNELSAGEIILDRLPASTASDLPSPEATGFSLPELPVSIDITKVAADRIELGPAVLGQALSGSLSASLSLADGEGRAALELLRTDDGPAGQISLAAAYANATRQLSLDFTAEEEAGGIGVTLLGIPGAPSAAFEVDGSGPLEDFSADIRLATDGEERLTGQVVLQGDASSGHRLTAAVAGNLAPVLAPAYVDFFGSSVSMAFDARRSDGGRIYVDRFDVKARALTLTGTAEIAADGLPEVIDLRGKLAAPDGEPVLVPFGDTPTLVDAADVNLRLDQSSDESWSGGVTLTGLDRDDVKIASARLDGSGRIGRSSAGRSFGGTFDLAADGVAFASPDLAQAIGSTLDGGFRLAFSDGMTGLGVSDLSIAGNGISLGGNIRVEGLDTAFLTSGTLSVTAADFSRFSGLANRTVGGSGTLTISGSASSLSGFFDADIGFAGAALSVGVDEIDRLLSDQSTIAASLRRDDTGTLLRAFRLDAGPLGASATGKISSRGSSLTGTIDFSDLSALGPGYAGTLAMQGSVDGTPDLAKIRLDSTGQSLRLGNPEVDKLLAGQSRLALQLAVNRGIVQIEDGRLETPQLTASATGEIAGATRNLTLQAKLANLALLAPGFQGPLTVSGTANQDATGYTLRLTGLGPGDVNAAVTGRVANDFASADLAIRGTGRAELANLFIAPRAASGALGYDLRLDGPIDPSALSGRVTLSDGRITDPDLGLSLEAVEGIGTLQNGTLRLSATSGLSSGGRLRVDGPIGLAPPNRADLTLTLDSLRLYDPELYETRVSGTLALAGPLTAGPVLSGRLNLADTEVRVPSSGFSSAAALLDIRHRNEPQAVRTTRSRAKLLDEGSGEGAVQASARPVALDLVISAPSRVFVRGRGIDAELGGELRLGGTSSNVLPSGGFQLIRGRMDILGKRLVLSRADLTLEGSLVPEIGISASTESDGVQSFVNVDGPADDPKVTFTSNPDLPQEEVLARLLFGRGLENISVLQAAQLANAVATLAGRGGEGVISRLRRSTGLDDLDVTMAEDGSASLKAGKYISDNAYTEIEVDQEGRSRINLNLDLREGVTVKGRLGADGETGIGIFIERDY